MFTSKCMKSYTTDDVCLGLICCWLLPVVKINKSAHVQVTLWGEMRENASMPAYVKLITLWPRIPWYRHSWSRSSSHVLLSGNCSTSYIRGRFVYGVNICSLPAAVSRIVTTCIFPSMLCRHLYCYWHIQHCCIKSSSILCAFGVSENLI